MVRRKFVTMVASTALLYLILVASCSQWFGDGEFSNTLQLNIASELDARGINVDYFEVTELEIEVVTERGEPITSIWWTPREGQQTYMVVVPQSGGYFIRVNHFGSTGGDDVWAYEESWFEIMPMVITVIDVTPGMIGVIRVNGEEPQPPEPVRDCELVGEWIARGIDTGLGFPVDGHFSIGPDGYIEALQFQAGTDILVPGSLRGWVVVCSDGILGVAVTHIYQPPPDGWFEWSNAWRSEYVLDGDVLDFATDIDGDGVPDLHLLLNRM